MAAQCPMRWETTAQHWWFATPLDWATTNGYFDVVRELLSVDGNLLIMLTSLRRIRRLEAAWEDKATSIDAAKGRGLVARELMGECETSEGNNLIDAGYGGWLLYTFAVVGDVELARCLLKRKPLLVLGEGEYGVTDILYAAARSKNAEIFREILGLAHDIKCLGCDQEDDAAVYESSPSFEMLSRDVHATARGGSVEILRELFKNCHDVAWYRDSQGSTALHSTTSKGQLEAPLELRELHVYAPLSMFPKSIGRMKHIEKIVVTCMSDLIHLKTLPEEFCHLSLLQYLYLRCPDMKSLLDSFGFLTNLLHLNLSRCWSLHGLPNSFGNLIQLKYLNLEYCSDLTLLEETFANIRTLEYLNLSDCKSVEVFPRQVAHQLSLEILIPSETNLKELHGDIGNLSSLEEFSLGNALLEMLPCSLGHLSSLKKLWVFDCPELKSLPHSLGLLTQLSTLWVGGCGIQFL